MNNNKTKNIILAVLVVGLVGMTIAYAALTQQLNITDNVATVSSNWRVRFAPTVTTSVGTTIAGTTTGATYTSNTPIVTNDQQTITGLQATFTKPGDYVEVAFTVRNEGNIAAKGQSVTLSLGNLTCANGTGSSIDQSDLNTFCSKLVKWVRHSDGVTEWSSEDTLAAYSGSGDNYPHIDGILRIEYPSTLSNSDIEAINGGSVVVTLGDTTLHFEQDNNATAQSGGNNQSGGGNEQGGNNQPGGNQQEETGHYVYKFFSDWSETLNLDPWNEGKEYSVYLRKNVDTNVEEDCAILSGGTACFEKHLFDCTLTQESGTGNWLCNDTSSYVYRKKQEFESKGATCTFNHKSYYDSLACTANNNDDLGCTFSSGEPGTDNYQYGAYTCYDPGYISCWMWDEVPNDSNHIYTSNCTD